MLKLAKALLMLLGNFGTPNKQSYLLWISFAMYVGGDNLPNPNENLIHQTKLLLF